MNKTLYISDPKILSIPIIECHEPLIDIKDSHEIRYGEPPECELTQADYTKIRKTVFEKLCQIQKDLPYGWRIRLYEGFRSITVQKKLFEQEFKRVVKRYPDASYEEQFYETTRLVSPVVNLDGSNNIPAHNTGGAIDIELIDTSGELVNMGMAIKDWNIVSPDLCLTDCKRIGKEARINRKLLYEIMQANGFVNYPTEWWHYSYGDRYWAYHQSSKYALYGSANEISYEYLPV